MSWHCSRQRLPGTLLALVAVFVGCSGDNTSLDGGPPATGTISFDGAPPWSLELAPGDVKDVGVSASAGLTAISLGLDGEYGDGWLELPKVATTDGHAIVRLHAPSSPATFHLIASANKATSARMDVAVSANGFATLHVIPFYTGRRPVPIVVASAFLKAACRDLAALPAKDGSPIVVGTPGETLVLEHIPAGGHVAVTVRIAHYATGCVDIDALAPSATRDVPITVYDRPIDLAATDLNSTLTFKPEPIDSAAWTSAMGFAGNQTLDAFSPGGTGDGKRLLDAMAQAIADPSDKQAFLLQRSNMQWDSSTSAWVVARGTLRTPAGKWLMQGIPSTQQDLAFKLKAGASAGSANVTLAHLGPINALSGGLSAPIPFSWVADADDSLHLKGSVQILPTKLAAASADVLAVIDVPSSSDVASALAIKIDCKGLGAALAQNGYAFAKCDASCTASLCSTALGAMWKSAGDTSSSLAEQTLVSITATLQATVGEFAEPQSFSGAWLGQVTTSKTNFLSKGLATGSQ